MSLWSYALTVACSVSASIVGTTFASWWRERRREKREIEGVRMLNHDMRELKKDYATLAEVVVGLRGQVKYLEGRMNFKNWQKE